MKMKLILFLLFAMPTFQLIGQFNFVFDPSIPVFNTENYLSNPWGGGLNFTQFSNFDYDYDGDMDLMLFDRSSNNIRVLVQEDNGGTPYYQTDYYAKDKFPSNLRYRATLVDYDNDGRKDLFTYEVGGIKVYRNIGNIVTGLQWELVSNLLYSQYPLVYTNLNVSSSDLPAIIDVDFDGDVDILTFHQLGQHMEYHKNQSMELYGIPDSLIFELRNECWGKFSEDPSNNTVLLNDPNAPCVGGAISNPENDKSDPKKGVEVHSGSSILALDYDNSGVLDLVLGDVSFTSLNLLLNGGSFPNSDSPMISQDPFFPSNTVSADLEFFPGAFYVDVNFDNVRDLLVGVNAEGISADEKSIWFYENIGSDTNPNFMFSGNDYFQYQMIEHGSGSVPVLFDVNEDGLNDLLVANFSHYVPTSNLESRVAYYVNSGTAIAPEYSFIDNDFLNLSQFNYGLRIVPTFGDIDNDGDKDMFLGLEDGTLVLYENESIGAGAIFNTAQLYYEDNLNVPIDVGDYAFPQLFDITNDGLLDLVIGNEDGTISFYENSGTATTPVFQLQNSMLGNVDVSTGSPNGFAAPHFFQADNAINLFIGNRDGSLLYYDSIESNLSTGATFNLVGMDFAGINVEGFSSFFIGDVDNDGQHNLFVGQDLGGLFHFTADSTSSIGIAESELDLEIIVYPNPIDEYLVVRSENLLIREISLCDVNGKVVCEKNVEAVEVELNVSQLPSGFYLLDIQLEGEVRLRKKLIKQN